MKFSRTSRISEEIKKIVSNLIMNELKDPRISRLTSITRVETTNDLRYCFIYVSVYDDTDSHETLEGLNKAKGFIRNEIGKQLKLRYTPEPIFKLDESIKQGIYINNLIKKVTTQDNKADKEEDNDELS